MTETLKPCPFCGGEPHMVESAHTLMRTQMFFVRCNQCGASSNGTFNALGAPDRWNQRAAPREPGEAERPSDKAIMAALSAHGVVIFGDTLSEASRKLADDWRIPATLRAAYAVDFPAAPRPDAGDGTGETGATSGGPHDG